MFNYKSHIRKIYKEIAHLSRAYRNCLESKNEEWLDKHEEKINEIIKKFGFNSGQIVLYFNFNDSEDEKLIFDGEIIIYNEDKDTVYQDIYVEITPSLLFDFDLVIDCKGECLCQESWELYNDYLNDNLHCFFDQPIDINTLGIVDY